jgi:hypothetical protein
MPDELINQQKDITTLSRCVKFIPWWNKGSQGGTGSSTSQVKEGASRREG